MGMPRQTYEHMLNKTVKEGECLLWTGCKDKDGYGLSSIGGKKMPAHRAAWILTYGATDLYVLHKCSNRSCINPYHLYAGTQKQNVQDQKDAGTFVYGEKNGVAKLKNEDVLHIKSSTFSTKLLAKYYEVSYSTIWDIRKGRTWKHLK